VILKLVEESIANFFKILYTGVMRFSGG
jgi:hypothetical protein